MTASSNRERRPIRVLIAKPGLDGHDVGAKLICRALNDAGMEATYSGLKRSPEEIARQAEATAVDVVGLSILSGAHLPLCRQIITQLKKSGLDDKLLIVGGVIPEQDRSTLAEMGFSGVFPVGTPFEEIVDFLEKKVTR